MVKKKRTISKKTLAALKKGREKLSAMRKKKGRKTVTKKKSPTKRRKVVDKKHTDIIQPLFINTERKKMKRKTRKASRKVRRSAPRYYGIDKKNIMGIVKDGFIAAIGGVGSSFVANKIPAPAQFKPFIPVAIGMLISSSKMGKTSIGRAASLGMVAAGAIAAIRQFVPQVALLAGEEEYYGVPEQIGFDPEEEQAMLGYQNEDTMDELLGIPTMSGSDFVNSSDI